MAKRLHVMDQTGHSTKEFADAKTTEEAMALVTDRLSKGYRIAVRDPDGKSSMTKAFDPSAEEQLLIPPLVGG